MIHDIERVAGPYDYTEGPVWTGHSVLFSEIPTDRILEYVPSTNETRTALVDLNHPNGLAIGSRGGLYVCEMGGGRVVRYGEDGVDVIASEYDGAPLNSPNDVTLDTRGELWFSDPAYEAPWVDLENKVDHCSVYRVSTPLSERPTMERATVDTTMPNGLVVHDGELYVANSPTTAASDAGSRDLRRYEAEAESTFEERLYDFGNSRGVDGMCATASGNVLAVAGERTSQSQPSVYVFDRDGNVLHRCTTPCDFPTNCTLGPRGSDTIYLTGDGCLYEAKTTCQKRTRDATPLATGVLD